MARQIKIESTKIRELVTKFAEWLTSTKITDGKVKFSADLGKIERKAKLTFTGVAWLKMQWLIATFSTECGWYGIVHRSDEEDEYIVEDIVVYPQSVTGSTVTIDEAELSKWQMTVDDDTINHLRMHGHSHVNMNTTPSGTDEEHYEKILSALRPDDFYVFCIYNKSGAHTIRIYDFAKNILFENGDVEVLVQTDDGVFDFMESVDNLVTTKVYRWQDGVRTTAPVPTTTVSGGSKDSKGKTSAITQSGKRFWWDDDDDDWQDYEVEWCGHGSLANGR